MKIAILGGGPSGLYLAILLKKGAPDWNVTVVEQNPRDATFGFGVTMAAKGLLQLKQADEQSYQAMTSAMRYSNSQNIVHREVAIEVVRTGLSGSIGRLNLLTLLHKQCDALGVTVHFGLRLSAIEELSQLGFDDADVVVGADGINSMVRNQFAQAFGTTRRSLTNHFAWYGTTRLFETSGLVFRKFEGGSFVGHYYAYDATMSTFVAECDDATWHKLGLESRSDDERRALFERVYAPELNGHPLISNNSQWRQFPVIRNEHFQHGRYALMGDALASAHFSIGSGTRLAMTDAIALADALLHCEGNVREGLLAYEINRRPQQKKLIDASERSFDWYERMGEWMDRFTPEQFVFNFMTRTGRVDEERLRREYPSLMSRLGIEGKHLPV